jgi:hypothetical protein
VTVCEQPGAEVTAEEAGAAGDEDALAEGLHALRSVTLRNDLADSVVCLRQSSNSVRASLLASSLPSMAWIMTFRRR